MYELNEFNDSSKFLIISPVQELNYESSPWEINFPLDDELSLNNKFQSRNFFFNQFTSKNKEILENIKKENQKNEPKEEVNFFNKQNIKVKENDDFPNFNIFKEIDQETIPKPIEEEEEEKKEKKESSEIWNKSTGDNTNTKKIKINKLIFGIKGDKKIRQRTDYAIKNIKVYISKFLTNYGNVLIKECNFPNKFKKLKFFLPSYNYFTGNSNEKENKIFLNFTAEQILTYPEEKPKNKKKNNRLQRQNKEIITKLKDYIEETYQNEIPEKFQELLNFFKMSYEEIIMLFYKSNQFKDYSSSEKTQKLDEQFQKVKGFSLMENNGLIKLIKYNNKNNF